MVMYILVSTSVLDDEPLEATPVSASWSPSLSTPGSMPGTFWVLSKHSSIQLYKLITLL